MPPKNNKKYVLIIPLKKKYPMRPSTPPNDYIESPELQTEEIEELVELEGLEELEELDDDDDDEEGGGYLFEKRNEPCTIDINPDKIPIFDGMARRDFYTKRSFSVNADEVQSSTIRIIMNINNIHGVISDYTVPNNLRQRYTGIISDERSQLSLFIKRKLLGYDFYYDVGIQGGMEQVFCYLARKARFSRQDYNEDNDMMTSSFFYYITKKVLLRRSKIFRLNVDDINKNFVSIIFVVTLFRLNLLGKAIGTISKQLEDNENNDWCKYYHDFINKDLDWDQIIQSIKDNIDTRDTSRSGVYALFED
ncbi:unnamed protein product [Cunninghamella echinulata]